MSYMFSSYIPPTDIWEIVCEHCENYLFQVELLVKIFFHKRASSVNFTELNSRERLTDGQFFCINVQVEPEIMFQVENKQNLDKVALQTQSLIISRLAEEVVRKAYDSLYEVEMEVLLVESAVN